MMEPVKQDTRCCCGKATIGAGTVGTQHNDYVHEPYGQRGAFCGNRINHDMRDLEAERDALAARVEKLEAALKTVKTWCELNRREGSVIYKPVCEALKGGK